MQLHDYSQAYRTKPEEEEFENKKKSFQWIPFLKSLELSQISLVALVFAILYFVDYLNFFNSMQGLMTPSPVLGVASAAASSLTKQKTKEKTKKR
jgi:hypothetical protein